MVIIKIHHNPVWNLQNKVEETAEELASSTWNTPKEDIVVLYFQSIHQGVYGEVRFFDSEPIKDTWSEDFKSDLLIDNLTVEYTGKSISYAK
tara:strand:+ start:370 stop:645 length:276 start_codon:yes stop_codon:yes gene_type:complete